MTPFSWQVFLDQYRDRIVEEWQTRLATEVSELYARRPARELTMTTGKACDAFCQVLTHGDYTRINRFISEITRIRLEAGFPLADVQKAFELYRQILIPILVKDSPPDRLCRNIEALNTGLAYTIHRFSGHFQKMHETYLKEHARSLEQDVAARTVELKESEQRYRRLVEEIRDGYLILRKERIEFVNPAFCTLHGVSSREALGRSFLCFVAEDDREKVRQIITGDMIRGTEPEAFEFLRKTRQGACLPTEINFRPSRFRGQEYHLCIVRDITKRVEMEKKSRKMEQMAYIGHLTASLSHEIRNPLSSVKMNLQILSKNRRFTGNDERRLAICEREIRRLEGILQQLLDFAKPVSLNPEKVDISRLLHGCVELLEVKISKQDIHCSIREDPHLPSLTADRAKLEQLVINLLLNAIDSVKEQGQIRITTRSRDLDKISHAVIRVEDDGMGISKEALPRIFEPFYTTKTVGTGLGLANVKHIVQAHGGRVRVESPEGRGTAFEVCLPFSHCPAATRETRPDAFPSLVFPGKNN
ncbi:ATP-binding protein [Desulfospira joergensenii]|uniref:ATP-binding protein n=1 Tax=Desulfospira joergensenii TaxID=53329 RepID=UPI0003B6C69C|nr:ATP-binding protein [Desulfospira joergensenii]